MRGGSFARDALSVYGTKLFLAVAALLSRSLVSRTLGPEGASLYATAVGSALLVNSFASLGINRVLTVAYAQKWYEEHRFFGNAVGSLALSSGLSIAALATLLHYNHADLYGWNAFVPILIAVPFMLTTEYGNGVFLAQSYVRGFNRSQIQRNVGFLAALAVFLVFVRALPVVTWAYLVGAVSGAFSPIWRLRHGWRTRVRFEPEVQRKFLLMGAQFAFTQFVLLLNYRVNVQMLGALAPNPRVDVGMFDNGVTLVETLWQIPTAVGTVLVGKSANSLTENEAVKRSCRALRTVLPIVVVAGVLMWILAPVLVQFFYGARFAPAADASRVLVPGVIVGTIYKVLNGDLAGRGKPLYAASAYGVAVVVNLLIGWWLIPQSGYWGAAVANTASYIVGGVIYLLLYVRDHDVTLAEAIVPRRKDYEPLLRKLWRR